MEVISHLHSDDSRPRAILKIRPPSSLDYRARHGPQTIKKMSLIQPLKFRMLKMGCFKMPHLHMAIFHMVVTLASGLSQKQW